MNQSTAVTISWILAVVLLLAVCAAVYAVYYAAQQRTRAETVAREVTTREDALEYFVTTTMPFAVESTRHSDSQVELPTGNERFPRLLRGLAERYISDLHMVQAETRDRTRHEAEFEAQQAISQAESAGRAEIEAARAEADKVRNDVQAGAHEATSAAVRSFGTSVVSLGADVGQVVSDALRRHRGDEVYETLSRIDHNVQQMIRQAQSYVIVCGGLPGRRWPQQSLTDIVGGAIGRVRDYTRVRPGQLDRVVISRAVEPLVHTLATLLDNALRYSPPTSFVDVSFQEGHHGVTIIIDDAGVRMNAEQMEEARQILAGERAVDIHQLGPAPRVGLPGIAALARRYGFSVYVDGPNAYGGMRAMVFVPETLLTERKNNSDQPAADPAVPTVSAPAPVEPVAVQPNPPMPAPSPIREPEPVSIQEPEPVTTSTVHEITPGGLPRRRRRTVSVSSVARLASAEDGTVSETTALPRPEIATAWHSGSQSGRAAFDEHSEGMTS
ncbi:ATP-binding protein [Nocardia miyunensis]|uniref:ATP-binding protein n=1 Tax=Nocardia miyunensis TaxID=282684 RepID=UPI00082B9EEA|nr:ATP-binding protein [Nocardia miyunensis]